MSLESVTAKTGPIHVRPNPFEASGFLPSRLKNIYGNLLLTFKNTEDRSIKIGDRLEKMFWWIMDNDSTTVVSMLKKLEKDRKSSDLWARALMVVLLKEKFSRQTPLYENIRPDFPAGELPFSIGDNWKNARLVRSEKSLIPQKYFLVLDLDISSAWTLTDSEKRQLRVDESTTELQNATVITFLTEFINAYFNHRSLISKNVPLKIAIPVNLFDRLTAEREIVMALQRRDGMCPGTSKNGGMQRQLVNKAFRPNEFFSKANKIFIRLHGWTGSADASLGPKVLTHLALLGDDAVGIFPSGAGIDFSLADNLFGLKATTPKVYADQIFTLLDFMKIWDKEIYLNAHSLAGAAAYWLVDKIIKRSDELGVRLPSLKVICENPALKGTCRFLEDWLLRLGELSLKTGAASLAPSLLSRISLEYAKMIAPEHYSEDVRKQYAGKFSDLREAPAVLMESEGLRRQEDLPSGLVDRLNNAIKADRLSFVGIIAGDDRITSAPMQLARFKEYGLKHPVVNLLKDGHFVHMSDKFLEIMKFLYGEFSQGVFNETLKVKLKRIASEMDGVAIVNSIVIFLLLELQMLSSLSIST